MPRFISGTQKDFAPDDIVVAELLSPVTAAGCADHLNNLSKFEEPTKLYSYPLTHKPVRDAAPALFYVVDTQAKRAA